MEKGKGLEEKPYEECLIASARSSHALKLEEEHLLNFKLTGTAPQLSTFALVP